MYVCRSIILIDTIIMWIRDIGRFSCQFDYVLQNKTENMSDMSHRSFPRTATIFRNSFFRSLRTVSVQISDQLTSDVWSRHKFKRMYTRTLWSSRYSFHEENDTVAITSKVRTTRIKISFEVMSNHSDLGCSQTVSQRVDPQISFKSLWRRLDVSHFCYHVQDDHSVMKVHHVPSDLDHESIISQASCAGINLESLDLFNKRALRSADDAKWVSDPVSYAYVTFVLIQSVKYRISRKRSAT